MGDRVRIWQKITHGPPGGAIDPANPVATTSLNVGSGHDTAGRGYHFLTRPKVYATASADLGTVNVRMPTERQRTAAETPFPRIRGPTRETVADLLSKFAALRIGRPRPALRVPLS